MTLRVVFMGSPEFAAPTLKALNSSFQVVGVVTQPDKPRGRGRDPKPTAVKQAALSLGLTVQEPEDIGSQQFLSLLAEMAPGVIVVAAYGKILPAAILKLPRMGCVNLHASLLPRHRGASPINAAILSGDSVTGLSTILMDEGMDTGDILLQVETHVNNDDTAGSLHDRLMELGADLVVETLRRMAEGKIEPKPQDHALATYTKPLARGDGRLDWGKESEYLNRLVRAVDPWPGAFSYISGQPLKIWRAVPISGTANPGVIASIGLDGISVGTGKGLLVLQEVQAPGKKRMSGEEFARGRRLKTGDSFDLLKP